MKRIPAISFTIIICLGLINSCEKKSQMEKLSAGEEKWVPIPLELPKPMFVGHSHPGSITHLEPVSHKPREPFLAPKEVINVALNKSVTSSEATPIIGSLDMIVDGEKEHYGDTIVELGPNKQWVAIDLGDEYELYAVVIWHFHKIAFRVYFDIVVQVSSDPDFENNLTTLFNNDIDNSLGLGTGTDMHYVEKAEGRLVNAKGIKARFIRLYSQGNSQNDYSHYIEVEAWGRPIP